MLSPLPYHKLPPSCATASDASPDNFKPACAVATALKSKGWRKGWDSNPRYPCRHAGFQDRCLKPLGHPSVAPVMSEHVADCKGRLEIRCSHQSIPSLAPVESTARKWARIDFPPRRS